MCVEWGLCVVCVVCVLVCVCVCVLRVRGEGGDGGHTSPWCYGYGAITLHHIHRCDFLFDFVVFCVVCLLSVVFVVEVGN